MSLTGVLLLDKPLGPTSHDVVARIRHVARESRVGHAGTLDPRATGLLVLLLGQATRLASILTGSDKTYDAGIRLGFATTTDDAEGEALGAPAAVPDAAAIDAALDAFRGTFDQVPPKHSAKKIAGEKAYDLARRDQDVDLKPVSVTVRELTRTDGTGAALQVHLVASAGFYVRALARDLGARLGCGAHLEALRRTRSGAFDVRDALTLEAAERLGPGLAERLIPPADALAHLPRVDVNEAGWKRVQHGNPLAPEHLAGRYVPPASAGKVRICGADGRLLALADSRGGALHPAVVLGYDQ